jgi:hypothetical protein
MSREFSDAYFEIETIGLGNELNVKVEEESRFGLVSEHVN